MPGRSTSKSHSQYSDARADSFPLWIDGLSLLCVLFEQLKYFKIPSVFYIQKYTYYSCINGDINKQLLVRDTTLIKIQYHSNTLFHRVYHPEPDVHFLHAHLTFILCQSAFNNIPVLVLDAAKYFECLSNTQNIHDKKDLKKLGVVSLPLLSYFQLQSLISWLFSPFSLF